MGILNGIANYLTGADLPTSTPSRYVPDFDARQYGNLPPRYAVGRPVWPERNPDSYRREGYAANVTVYACITTRANAVSAATIRVYRDVDGQPEEIAGHPVRELMQRPNPTISEAEFLVVTSLHMDVYGFSLIEKVRSANGRVVELWHLRPDWARPIPREDGSPDWQYTIPGRPPVILPAEDVMVVTGSPGVEMSYTGVTPISVALREIGVDNDATAFLKEFFEHGGAPRYALVSPNPIPDQARADAIRDRWMQTYGGYQQWVSVALLHGGLDVRQIGFDLNEMAYPQLRMLTEARICTAFAVPPILIGAQVGLERSTFANFAEARRTFYEDVVVPLWARLDGALTRNLLAEFEVDRAVSVGFDTSGIAALQDDVTPAWQRATAALLAGGITLNQFQREIGLPGFDAAGDVLYLPMAAQPVAPSDLAAFGMPPAPLPAPAAVPAAPAPDNDPDDNDPNDDGPDGIDDTPDDPPDAGDRRRARSRAARDLEARRIVAVNGRRQFARLARRLAPEMAAFFRAQGERIVADVMRRGDAPLEVRQLDDIDWLAELEALAEVLEAHYGAVGATAFADVSRTVRVGVTWDQDNPRVRRVMDRLGGRIVGISETTRADVARVVTQGIEEGLGNRQIADRLYGMFEETYRNRSLTIARTESQVSYNLASAAGYEETGVVSDVQLLDNPDHVDPYNASDGLTCAERNGLIVPLADAAMHIEAEHPNGSLAVAPVVVGLGEG